MGYSGGSKPITGPFRERPLPVRSRKADLRRRVNGKVEFRHGRREVASHAGLELFREYLKGSGFVRALRRAVGASFPGADFGAVAMLLTLLGLILVGGRRVLHLEREQGDPVMARFAGLDRLPSPRTDWRKSTANWSATS